MLILMDIPGNVRSKHIPMQRYGQFPRIISIVSLGDMLTCWPHVHTVQIYYCEFELVCAEGGVTVVYVHAVALDCDWELTAH